MLYVLLGILSHVIYLGIVISLIIFAWPVILTLLLIALAIVVITLITWGISNIIKEREANEAVSKIYAAADKAKQMREEAEEKKKAEEQQELLKAQQIEMRKAFLLLQEELDKEYGLVTLNEKQEEEIIDNQEKLKSEIEMDEYEIGLRGASTPTQAGMDKISNILLSLVAIALLSLAIKLAGDDFHTQDIVNYVRSLDLIQQFNNFFASALNQLSQ